MNKNEIIDAVKRNFGKDLSKVTLLGRAALVVDGFESATDKVIINYADKEFIDFIPITTEYAGEEYRMFNEDILLCCKNMSVYQTLKTADGFNTQSVSSAITYLRDQTGYYRYKLANKEVITEDDKKTLKKMLNYLKVTLPAYSSYKVAGK